MSRSGYSDECEGWHLIMWRGAVKSSIRGKRGQQFLSELLEALDAMTEKVLITNELEASGQFCTIGVIAESRKINMEGIDPEESNKVASMLDIAPALAKEIFYKNDDHWDIEAPWQRWHRMREWVANQIDS